MSQSLVLMLKKVRIFDVIVVGVFLIMMMCLFQKMYVVEGLARCNQVVQSDIRTHYDELFASNCETTEDDTTLADFSSVCEVFRTNEALRVPASGGQPVKIQLTEKEDEGDLCIKPLPGSTRFERHQVGDQIGYYDKESGGFHYDPNSPIAELPLEYINSICTYNRTEEEGAELLGSWHDFEVGVAAECSARDRSSCSYGPDHSETGSARLCKWITY